MWGICQSCTTRQSCTRFTPTHVGDMRYDTSRPEQRRGSPPRMWGICGLWLTSRRHSRFTPTHVGDMAASAITALMDAVHPHACGGYVPAPPQAGLAGRFTPTHVGDICRHYRRTCRGAVHPHACGGYADGDAYRTAQKSGSPPRMWGIWTNADLSRQSGTVHPHACGGYVYALPFDRQLGRFTPTHVGDISHAQGCRYRVAGSPPRMWGILDKRKKRTLL